jgi:Zn-dependent protease
MIGRSRFGLYLGCYFGIRFYLDYSWFLIAALLTYVLGSNLRLLHGYSETCSFAIGAIATLVYFFSILLHELGHSLVSQRCGIPVPRITLLFIGGIAEISREPDTARAELKIAAGGPGVSLILALLYGAGAFIAGRLDWDTASLVLQWLAIVNVILVVFNAIPGYPLDGGRILRAIIWARTGNLRKATFITTRIGIGFSWLLIGLGLSALLWFQGSWDGLVFIFIGLFLKSAAESGYTSTLYHEILAGVRISDIMTRTPVCIPAYTPLNIVVDEYFLSKNHVAYPVIDAHGDFRGMLRLEYLKELPRDKWPWTTAGEFVSSHDAVISSIDAGQPAQNAMRRLVTSGQGRLAVLDAGKVVGIVTRHDVLTFITIHSELTAQ